MLTGLLCGMVLGFVLQRGRYCMVSAYRDVYLTKDNRMFIATFIAITVQSSGIYALSGLGLIQLAEVSFTWLAAIFGGLIFGIGIVLAGGCAAGTWYRTGEGLLGSWIALFAYMLGGAMTYYSLFRPLNETLSGPRTNDVYIYETLGISPWVLIILLSVSLVIIVWRHLKPPTIPVPIPKAKKTGLAHLLFEKRWHPFVTAVMVGMIAIAAWPLSEVTGRMYGLGITVPSANFLTFLVTGDIRLLDWGTFLVIGIALGSFLAAKGSGEFRWRLPDIRSIRNHFVGGIMMGVGAGIAGGCTIGNGLVNTSLLTWQGWVATLFIMVGTWIGTYWFIVKPRQIQSGKTDAFSKALQ
jgi:uncharacterized membrane protein YedE/YeeE